MKKIIPYLLLLSSGLLSCNSESVNKAQTEKENYEITKERLLKKEQKNPTGFLIVSGKNKKNVLGQTVVQGIISNKATIAVFKDVELKIYFYSKTHTLLETDKETIFEQLNPGETKNFKTKYFAPKGTDSVAMEVLGAKIVNLQNSQEK